MGYKLIVVPAMWPQTATHHNSTLDVSLTHAAIASYVNCVCVTTTVYGPWVSLVKRIFSEPYIQRNKLFVKQVFFFVSLLSGFNDIPVAKTAIGDHHSIGRKDNSRSLAWIGMSVYTLNIHLAKWCVLNAAMRQSNVITSYKIKQKISEVAQPHGRLVGKFSRLRLSGQHLKLFWSVILCLLLL